MNVTKLMDLETVTQSNVKDLYRNCFPDPCTELEPSTTYVFHDNSILIGYAEIGRPSSNQMATHLLKKEYSEFLSEAELNLCHGLYLKYIGVNPQFKRKGYGTYILDESVKRARSDQRDFSVSPSVAVIVEGASATALDAIHFFRKNKFIIISEYRVNDSIDTYFQKDIPFDNEPGRPL